MKTKEAITESLNGQRECRNNSNCSCMNRTLHDETQFHTSGHRSISSSPIQYLEAPPKKPLSATNIVSLV